ncbi:MAG: EFR1 family ferrodoxin [Methanoregula sp.]
MKSIIYYFTGTGNSLVAAKAICARLGDCELIPIATLGGSLSEIVPVADRVGIVCPVYDFGLPSIVAAFAERLNLSGTGYCFAVLTMGGMGGSALHQMDGIIQKHGDRQLDAAFTVRMPGNFVPMYAPPQGKKREEILVKADKRIGEISEMIDRGLIVRPAISPLTSLLKRLMYAGFIEQIHGADKNFTADEKCTSCGTCARVCPVQNIVMENEKPSWMHHCELCLACLHFCPVAAIQWGPKTAKRGRFKNPSVTLADMKKQRGE